jgi:hypothetical protein
MSVSNPYECVFCGSKDICSQCANTAKALELAGFNPHPVCHMCSDSRTHEQRMALLEARP